MTRYPSVDRAVHQLERHRSGTPSDVPSLDERFAVFGMVGVSFAEICANLGVWRTVLIGKREAS